MKMRFGKGSALIVVTLLIVSVFAIGIGTVESEESIQAKEENLDSDLETSDDYVDFGTFEYGAEELDLDIVMEEDKTARWVFYGDGEELETIETNDVEFDWSEHGDYEDRDFRVKIEEYGDVLEIAWGYVDLTGEIPGELGDLTNLEYLNLRFNDLSGEIPAELGDLTDLEYLNLRFNDLSGEIPAELGDLTDLEWLYLSSNDLSGEIPAELGDLTNLEELMLESNELSGEIPTWLGDLTNLEWLFLHSNGLSGEIPSEFSNLTELTEVRLQDNDFDSYGEGAFSTQPDLGYVEDDFAVLNLSNNNLSTEDVDTVLSDLVDSLQLEDRIPAEVDLTDNSEPSAEGWDDYHTLEDEEWDVSVDGDPDRVDFGTFEYGADELDLNIVMEEGETARWVFYGDGTELETIETNDVEFDWSEHGDFDDREFKVEIEEYGDVFEIDWHFDDLTGNIPAELGDLENLEYLDLWNNELSGEIPSELGDLTNLEWLFLHSNGLSGEIPEELGDLENLEWLYLYNNDLSGEIPEELGDLTNLESLWLSRNDLSGEIPGELGDLTHLECLYLSIYDLK